MINKFLEICERSYTGDFIEKDDWDVEYVCMATMDIIEKYDLNRTTDEITPNDPDLAKRIFNAGKDLLLKIGIFNMSTNRIIKITQEDIDFALKNRKSEVVMGMGKDARTLYARTPEDSRRPLVTAGNPGCPTPENLFKPTVTSWAKEPVVDMITCGSMIDVEGYTVRRGEPSELLTVRRELAYLHEVANEVGRPGIGMLAAESSVSEVGDLAAANPNGIRTCDSHLTALLNEMMVDRDNLVRAASGLSHGMKNITLACVMVGGLAGPATGAAVLMVASMLASQVIYQVDYHLCHPIHVNHIATSTRECMWLSSIVCQAFAQEAPSIIVCDIYPKSGAGTMELLYEVAANAIAITVSGGHLEGVGSCDGVKPHGTGLEVRLMGEVGAAVARQGITRETANKIILKLLAKYEHVFKGTDGNPGKHFTEVYNMNTITPTAEWEGMYFAVKEELKELGIIL